MRAGDEVRLRETGEPLVVVALVDAGGTLLVRDLAGGAFQVARDEVDTAHDRHGACCPAC